MTSPAPRRRMWWNVGAVIAGAVVAGYAVTCALYPTPILPKPLVVPALRGVDAESALVRLTRLGLRGRIADSTPDAAVPGGSVAWQAPAAETVLPEGAMVRIGVSSGPPIVSVPDLAGLDLALAERVITAAGLKIGTVDTVRNDGPGGTVVDTRPDAGQPARPGDLVQVSVSGGRSAVRVPDLTGLPLAEARRRLADFGLRVGNVELRAEGRAGTVLNQLPSAGETIDRDAAVHLIVAGARP